MDAEMRCRQCGEQFYFDVYGSEPYACPACGSKDLEWVYVDLSKFGCG